MSDSRSIVSRARAAGLLYTASSERDTPSCRCSHHLTSPSTVPRALSRQALALEGARGLKELGQRCFSYCSSSRGTPVSSSHSDQRRRRANRLRHTQLLEGSRLILVTEVLGQQATAKMGTSRQMTAMKEADQTLWISLSRKEEASKVYALNASCKCMRWLAKYTRRGHTW